mmetsp:Transcript_83842/g.232354  ORF Transcript_83842/g.232354 Transcript_83842/m.232354 type:complete len:363 (-) Transcript_83842:101-1189(-)
MVGGGHERHEGRRDLAADVPLPGLQRARRGHHGRDVVRLPERGWMERARHPAAGRRGRGRPRAAGPRALAALGQQLRRGHGDAGGDLRRIAAGRRAAAGQRPARAGLPRGVRLREPADGQQPDGAPPGARELQLRLARHLRRQHQGGGGDRALREGLPRAARDRAGRPGLGVAAGPGGAGLPLQWHGRLRSFARVLASGNRPLAGQRRKPPGQPLLRALPGLHLRARRLGLRHGPPAQGPPGQQLLRGHARREGRPALGALHHGQQSLRLPRPAQLQLALQPPLPRLHLGYGKLAHGIAGDAGEARMGGRGRTPAADRLVAAGPLQRHAVPRGAAHLQGDAPGRLLARPRGAASVILVDETA